MKPNSPLRRFAAVPALAFLAFGSLSQAAMVLYYNFDTDTGAAESAVANSGTTGVNGTYKAGTSSPTGTTALVASQAGVFGANSGTLGGNALQLTPTLDADGSFAPPYLNTNMAASFWGINNVINSDHTAMAWVRFANQTGDNMIFGQGDGNRVHLGSRGNQYWHGHWGDDVNSGTNLTDTANWHHVAWTNADDGTQQIFVDGVSVGGPGGTNGFGGFVPSNDLLIGTSGNDGSFNGLLDEVKIFDTLLTPAEIVAASVIVPEPSALVLGMLGVGGLILRRRR